MNEVSVTSSLVICTHVTHHRRHACIISDNHPRTTRSLGSWGHELTVLGVQYVLIELFQLHSCFKMCVLQCVSARKAPEVDAQAAIALLQLEQALKKVGTVSLLCDQKFVYRISVI
jgi:hypothetical protein